MLNIKFMPLIPYYVKRFDFLTINFTFLFDPIKL